MIKNIKNIYWMLAYAFRILDETYIEEKINCEEFENIYDLLCVMLTKAISKQIKRGLNKEYLTTNEVTGSLKGKINISKSIKLNSLNNKKMYCEYDKYSENSYMNRIVKTAAIKIINSNMIKETRHKEELKKLLIYFKNVSEIDKKDINWKNLRFNTNNKNYKILMMISYIIFEWLIINNKDGKDLFNKFIDDQKMYKLFEKFILEYFRYHYPEFGVKSPQIKWNIKHDEDLMQLLPKMQTDVVLYYKDYKLIIDAKYYSRVMQNNRLFNKESIRSGNLYQLYTYVKNADSDKTGKVLGMLIYAKTYEEDIGWNEFDIDGNKMIITFLDLEQDFGEIKRQLNSIAEWFRSKAINNI